MNSFLLSGILIITTVFLSCTNRTKKKEKLQQPSNITVVQNPGKAISLRLAGEIEFDRSYSSGMRITNEKELKKYYEEVRKSNPVFGFSPYDSLELKNKFQKFGFVSGNELLLKKFKYSTKTKFSLKDASGKEINIRFDFLYGRIGDHKIIAFTRTDTVKMEISGIMQELKYSLFDIIPGGFPEVVILSEEYVSNNEIYRFKVYEIKSKD
jgi:hypothetical protein